jgi:predicted transcriptional regulator
MSTIAVELRLSSQQYEQLRSEAQAHNSSVSGIAQVAIEEWLKRQMRLAQARKLMRELGQGLGESSTHYDVARNHDTYLYARERE